MPRLRNIFLSATLTASAALTLCACNATGRDASFNENKNQPVAVSYVALDIAPTVEFTLDKDGNVLSALGKGEDARAMLWDENGIVGQPLQSAIDNVLDLAVDCGFSSDNTAEVQVCVAAKDESVSDKVYEIAENAINNYPNSPIATVSSARQPFEATKTANVALAAELSLAKEDANGNLDDVSIEKYNLTKNVALLSQGDVGELLTQDTDALVEKMRALQSDTISRLGKGYEALVNEASLAFETTKQTAINALYPVYFANKAANESDDVAKRATIAKIPAANLYAAADSALLVAQNYLSRLDKYFADPVFYEDELLEIQNRLAEFGLTFDSGELENGVAKEDLYQILNSAFKRVDENDKQKFADIVAGIVKDICRQPPAQTFADAIGIADAALAQLKKMYDNGALSNLLPFAISGFTLYATNFSSRESVKNLIDNLVEVKEYALEAMALSDEDVAAIEGMKAGVEDALAKAKADFDNAVINAKIIIAELLQNKKQQLKGDKN